MNVSVKFYLHRANGFRGDIFCNMIFSFFAYWFPLKPINMTGELKHTWLIIDSSTSIFVKRFVNLSAMDWQLMPFFNSTYYKSMETSSCHSNQTKALIFIGNIISIKYL